MTTTHARTAGPESSGLLARPGGAGGGAGSAEHALAAAQAGLGNALVQRHLREGVIQAQMAVTAPDDEYEREADSVAARIMRMEAPGAIGGLGATAIQRQAAAPADETKKKQDTPAPAAAPPKPATAPPTPAKTATPPTGAAQQIAKPPPTDSAKKEGEPPKTAEPKKKDETQIARSPAAAGVPTVTPAVEAGVQSARGSGSPLPATARSFLEPRFGRDFSAVRVHADSHADSLARSLQADAFTTGRDVFFASGRYQPHTAEGRQLLAHELTHTVQQGASAGLVQRTNGGPPPPAGGGGGGGGGGGAAATDDEGAGGTYAGPGLPGSGSTTPFTGSEGNLNLEAPTGFELPGRKLAGAKTLSFPSVNIPGFKQASAPGGGTQWGTGTLGPFVKVPFTREDTQISVWRSEVALTANQPTTEWLNELGKLLNPGVTGPPFPVPPAPNVDFELRKAAGTGAADWQGTPRNLAAGLAIPTFNTQGTAMTFEVDHIRELQLVDYAAKASVAEHPPNFWLLESAINRESGTAIQATIKKRVRLFRDRVREYYRLRADALHQPGAAQKALTDMAASFTAIGAPELSDVRGTIAVWRLEFGRVDPTLMTGTIQPDKYWTADQIKNGEHLRRLHAQLPTQVPGHIRVFTAGGTGGAVTPVAGVPAAPPPSVGVAAVDFDANTPNVAARERNAFKPFKVSGKRLSTTPTGQSWGQLDIEMARNSPFRFKASGAPPPILDVKTSTVVGAGVVEQSQVLALFGGLEYKHSSPVEVDNIEVDPGTGVRLHGRIRADAPLLREGIDFEVSGDDVRVYKEFGIGALNAPAPFHIYSSSLTLSAGTESGLSVAGLIEFGIDRVGVGSIGASAGTRAGFALDGEFNFDSKLFQPARVAIHFHENQWSGEGDLGIPEGKVQGIRSAAVHVGYREGHLEASGTAQLSIPGIQRAGLSLVLDDATGMTIAGDVELANNIPGIRSGRGHAEVHQPAGGGDYQVAITGEAQPAIPGVDATVSFSYADGALTIAGHAAYSRGIASGTVDIGATNRPLDPAGQPIPGGTPGDQLHAYGGGTLTLRLAPWLQGTIGVHLLANGELEITGSVGLPAAINLFEARDYNRPIFHTPPIDIPIVGVAVAGTRVGIFATLSGGLDLSAGIGPGQLRQLGLTVTYNPDHEDQTHVEGGAQLHIPAHAGLRLYIRGGLGVGIPLVSATANLEVSGQLGLESALDADVHVDWTPGAGIVLDASASLSAEPRFRFAVDGTVMVEAGIGWLSATIYEKRWNLAAFEYGSGLRLGMRFPFHYEEGHPFELSWDDVQYDVPDIEPRQVLTGLLEQIT